MRKQIEWMCLMFASLSVGACTQDDSTHPEKVGGRVIFVMSTKDRANTRTQTDNSGMTSFVSGDEVGIFALKTEGKNTVELTANNLYKSEALEDGSLVWNSADAEKLKGATIFYGYYPYDAKNVDRKNIVHTIRQDQDTEESYNKSDLLTAVKSNVITSVAGEQVVELDFDHKLALVQVEVIGSGVKNTPADFKLIGVQPTVTVNFDKNPDDALFIATSGNATDVTMLKVSERIVAGAEDNRVVYRAVVPAQTLEAGRKVLDFAMGGFVYTPSHSKEIKLEAGRKRTLVVKLDDKGAVVFVDDSGITDWSADDEDKLSDKVYEGEDAAPLVAPLPEIAAEMEVRECATDYPADGYTGWWIKGNASTVTVHVPDADDDKLYLNVNSGNAGCFFAYWQGKCAVTSVRKYRLTFDYKGGKNKCVTGIAVVDRRDGNNYCFRPLDVSSDAVSDKVIDGFSNVITVPYLSEWTTFSYDFDLSQSALASGSFDPHPGSRVFENLGIIIWGGSDKKSNACIANIKFEPISE